jgi:hypothetical protein
VDFQQRLDRAPKVVDALKRGGPAEIFIWDGWELSGTICDWEQTGLMLEAREPGVSADGYVLPWSSIEQVAIREVSQRAVKFLPS